MMIRAYIPMTAAALLLLGPQSSWAEQGPGMMIEIDPKKAPEKSEPPKAPESAPPAKGAPSAEAPQSPSVQDAPQDQAEKDQADGDKGTDEEDVEAPGLREQYRSARQGYQGDPGLLGLNFPQNPKEAKTVVKRLFAALAKMEDAALAEKVTAAIERIWRLPGGDTVNLLLERASLAANQNNPDVALKLLDAAVDLAPDFAEAWSRRAFVHYMKGDTERALGDLRRTLALEPKHFRALQGLAKILEEQGQKKGALKAMEELHKLVPTTPGAQTVINNLKKEVEGQGI